MRYMRKKESTTTQERRAAYHLFCERPMRIPPEQLRYCFKKTCGIYNRYHIDFFTRTRRRAALLSISAFPGRRCSCESGRRTMMVIVRADMS